jgi:hypothetical protein
MANKYVQNLIALEDIHEELKLINGSNTDYITPNGNVYKYNKDYNKYYKKRLHLNKECGYLYCTITMNNCENISCRVNRLVALAYVENPNPDKLLVVGHKNNKKEENIYTNLYWTTTQENTQKAVNDRLLINKIGVENESSYPIKVISLQNDLVAVYGSMREAERNIENVDLSYLSKVIKRKGNYKPRGKKYKYIPITKEEFEIIDNTYKNIKLIENPKSSKDPSIFKAINLLTSEEIITDNQKQFAKEHGLVQSRISNAIKKGVVYENWEFELIEKTTYKEASGYTNFIDTCNETVLENIKTHEIKTFVTKKELKDYFGIKGHDILQYLKNNQLIFSEWKVIQA